MIAAVESLIDGDRYPIGDHSAQWIGAARRSMEDDGVAVLPGFLTDAAVSAMCAECDQLVASAHHSEVSGTPYLELPDESFDPRHPRRFEVRSSLSAIAYDLIPPQSALRRLYEWDGMLEVVSAVLGRSPLYRYSDPLGALNLAVMGRDDELGWHFDQTDFVVSIALQSSEIGGNFESACRVRSGTDERYDDVDAILRAPEPAEVPGVVSLPMTPGTLMLFEGRHSMHRVTPVEGTRHRYVALLAYDTKPGTDSSEVLKLVRYGRLP